MVPKSSDGDARPGSSSEPQPTEPMQISTGVTSSVLGKRKDPGERVCDRESVDDDEVKDDDDDDDDDDEEEKEEEEDEDDEEEEEADSDFEWDKDSFDGKVYHSSDDYSSYTGDKGSEERSRCYDRTVIGSKGFFENTDGFPLCMWGGFDSLKDLDRQFKYGLTRREFIIQMATECVEKYNKRKNKNVRFHEFVRANFFPGGFTKYYITFIARESDSLDDPLIEYQAKVGRRGGKTYPILCRPSPP